MECYTIELQNNTLLSNKYAPPKHATDSLKNGHTISGALIANPAMETMDGLVREVATFQR